MKNELSVFIDPTEKEFKVELQIIVPPYPLEKNALESKEYLLIYLFKVLKSFYDLLNKARKELVLSCLIRFPDYLTIHQYYSDIRGKLSPRQKQILDKWKKCILKKYSLLENWEIPIEAVILTHHFPIPYSKVPISYYLPPTEEEKKERQSKNLSVIQKAINLTKSWGVVEYPAIYFTSKISRTSLIEWINHHKFLFSAFNKNLKKETKTSSRMNIRTLRIGETVLIMKWNKISRWRDMEKKVDELDEECDCDDYWGEIRPDAEELRLAWKSYLKVITKLESGDSESL